MSAGCNSAAKQPRQLIKSHVSTAKSSCLVYKIVARETVKLRYHFYYLESALAIPVIHLFGCLQSPGPAISTALKQICYFKWLKVVFKWKLLQLEFEISWVSQSSSCGASSTKTNNNNNSSNNHRKPNIPTSSITASSDISTSSMSNLYLILRVNYHCTDKRRNEIALPLALLVSSKFLLL